MDGIAIEISRLLDHLPNEKERELRMEKMEELIGEINGSLSNIEENTAGIRDALWSIAESMNEKKEKNKKKRNRK